MGGAETEAEGFVGWGVDALNAGEAVEAKGGAVWEVNPAGVRGVWGVMEGGVEPQLALVLEGTLGVYGVVGVEGRGVPRGKVVLG